MRLAHLAKGIVAIAAITAAGTAQADASRFDLICTGNSASGKLSRAFDVKTTGRFTDRYRVDLTAKKWCMGECTSTSDLYEVTERIIVFHRQEDKDGDEFAFVNRESGHYVHRFRSYLLDVANLNDGTCEPAAFSGMPIRKF